MKLLASVLVLAVAVSSCQLISKFLPDPGPGDHALQIMTDYPTAIPDAALRTSIEKALGKSFGAITYGDLDTLTWLSGSGGVSSLQGISLLTHLTGIGVFFQNVTDLKPLKTMTQLHELWLQGNQITSLTPIAGLSGLTNLFVSDNPIPVSNVQSVVTLAHFPSLSGIGVGDANNRLTATQASNLLKPFQDQLNKLTLFHSAVGTDWSNFWTNVLSPQASTFAFLNLGDDSLADAAIDNIKTMTNLSFLYLQGNSLTTVAGLSTLHKLTDVNVSYNSLADISVFQTLYDAGAFHQSDWAEGIFLDVTNNGMDMWTGSANADVVDYLTGNGVTVNATDGNSTTAP